MVSADISIIIVNYNVKDYLLQCLRSVEQASAGLVVEVIVVDNNSGDFSVEYLKPLFPSVKFIKLDQNIGFGRANNVGIKEATGKYILFVNPDTILEEQNLRIMFDYMEANPGTGIAGCKMLNPDGTFELACRRGFPTPWVSFTKLFGLQKIFPNSKLFGSYNQTFQSKDEVNEVDAVSGAYMFARTEAVKQIEGFDPDFFMYGEDLDLCYRVTQNGWKIVYIPDTSIIHFRGQSTKRSSVNENKLFFKAMEVFSRKHIAHSWLLLKLLYLGIALRSFLAVINKFKTDILFIIADLLIINASFLAATKLRYDIYFNYPDYAYPIVFIVLNIVLVVSMISTGVYFETAGSIRKSFFGYLVCFFSLTILTYYFKEYATSRVVVLMMIVFGMVLTTSLRAMIIILGRIKGKAADRRVAIIGNNQQTDEIIRKLQTADARNTTLAGIITVDNITVEKYHEVPVLGNIEYISTLIESHQIHELILTDKSVTKGRMFDIMQKVAAQSVRIHVVQEYDDIIFARIINDITGFDPTIPSYNIYKLRYRIVKRLVDILISFILLTIGLPIVVLVSSDGKSALRNLFQVLKGRFSFVGLYGNDSNSKHYPGKTGLIGLAHISKPERLSPQAIRNLDEYYLENMSLTLDIDIILKYLVRK